MTSWSSRLMPGPLSRTSTRSAVAAPAQRDLDPARARASQNFTAFDSRLSMTCIRRSRSASTGGTALRQPRLERDVACSLNSWLVAASVSSIDLAAGRRSRSCHSALPDSILARSSTWLMSRVSRSVSLMMMPRNFCALRRRRGPGCRAGSRRTRGSR